MERSARRSAVFCLLLALAPVSAHAQSAAVGDAALLFAYRPRPGLEAEFERGYRRHLDWHAAHGDSLPWLAWTVVTGDRPGDFVDGTFGITLEAFDARVDPRGDGADAAINVTAFGDAVARAVYRRVEDSGAVALESGRPGALQRVVAVAVRPGAEMAFRDAARAALRENDGRATLYERVSGGVRPGYLLVVQMEAWADLDRTDGVVRRLVQLAGDAVVRTHEEVWAYRPDLSLLPAR